MPRQLKVVAATFFALLVLGFYLAHYVESTGFFTSAFTPLLAGVFYASILYTIVNAVAKATTPRKDIVALVEVIGAVLLTVTTAWFFVVFPLNFDHVGRCGSRITQIPIDLDEQRHRQDNCRASPVGINYRTLSRRRQTSLARLRKTVPQRSRRFVRDVRHHTVSDQNSLLFLGLHATFANAEQQALFSDCS
jgi:predicted PurR-regulated permease PerM